MIAKKRWFVVQKQFEFLSLPQVLRLFEIFNEHQIEAQFVGGCVRDSLRGVPTTDFDMAVNASIDFVISVLKINEVHCNTVGLKYGSIKATIEGVHFDLTTLRIDTECSGRNCKIVRTDSFEEDAKRRDFTVNALYVNEAGELFDYFNGISDLRNKKIIFIGDPEKRIQEDHLRILRYYRFCSKIKDYSNRYSKVLSQNAFLIKKLSKKRIQKEMKEIIDDKYIINIMRIDGILQQIE